MERLKAEGIKSSNIPSLAPSTKFLTKKERQELALTKLQIRRDSEVQRAQSESLAHSRFVTGAAAEERNLLLKRQREEEELNKLRREKEENKKSNEHDHEVKTIRDHYLGGGEKKRKIVKPSEKFARIFKFNWEADDDTMKNDVNPLYVNRTKINALYGRGYIAGVDLREQRKTSNFLTTLNEKRSQELRSGGFSSSNVSGSSDYNGNLRVGMSVDALAPAHPHSAVVKPKRYRCGDDDGLAGCHWRDKSLEQMTERDWRIFREDYDIRIKHGRATHPLRSWKESTLHPCFLDAVADLGYKEPSPIQRQAIPVGLLKRDMIGIAETGSGKTAAFLIPLLAYLQDLPAEYIARVDVEGPLALIMAPVRELAQQIEGACQKLAKYTKFRSLSIVGGESIAEQSNKLRQGVEIVVGTPGRLLDCINSHYMVLSQCNYLVLDEADRMIDMGFEETLVQIIGEFIV